MSYNNDSYGPGGGSYGNPGGRGQADDFGEPRPYGGQGGGSYGDSAGGSYGGGSYGGGGHGSSTGTSYGGGGYGGDDDFSAAEHHAAQHAGDSADRSLFSTALGMLSGKKDKLQHEDVDEDDAVQQHKKFYGSGSSSDSPASANNLGAAAAMQALKMFTSGSSGDGKSSSKSDFIGIAMGQAAKLFDQQSAQGKTHPDATKQDAIAQAAQMALKMYMKSEMGGSGGSSSGGGLLKLAGKFLS